MAKSGKILSISGQSNFKSWFEDIYTRHFERLYLYAFSITKQKPIAEDVVEEVFLQIWNKRPHYDDIKDVESYLFVSVKHLAIRMASRDPGKFTYSTYDEALQISDSIDPEKLLIGSELKGVVDGILNKLSPQAAVIYDLVKNRGLSHKDISIELGIAEKTVSNQMNLILNKVREGISQYLEDANPDNSLMRITRVISWLLVSGSILFV